MSRTRIHIQCILLFAYLTYWLIALFSSTAQNSVNGWHPIDIHQYFTYQEIQGLETQSCGVGWLGNNGTDHKSGPCCPNGHSYGSWQSPLQHTEELTLAYSTTPPFAAKSFFNSFPSTKDNYDILIISDSLGTQLFFGLFCGAIRIGATHISCNHQGSDPLNHYIHPMCAASSHFHTPHSYEAIFNINATTFRIRKHGQYPLKYPEEIIFQMYGRPDLVLMNSGANDGCPESDMKYILQSLIQETEIFAGRRVWWEIGVPHFENGGRYSGRNKTTFCGPILGDREFTKCNRKLRESIFAKLKVKIPVVELLDMEVEYHYAYPDKDCRHHVYTPLYYDVILHRMSFVIENLLRAGDF